MLGDIEANEAAIIRMEELVDGKGRGFVTEEFYVEILKGLAERRSVLKTLRAVRFPRTHEEVALIERIAQQYDRLVGELDRANRALAGFLREEFAAPSKAVYS